MKLGVNIDHIATLRNLRDNSPLNLVNVASLLDKLGLANIYNAFKGG